MATKVKCIDDGGMSSYLTVGKTYEAEDEGKFWSIVDDRGERWQYQKTRFVECNEDINSGSSMKEAVCIFNEEGSLTKGKVYQLNTTAPSKSSHLVLVCPDDTGMDRFWYASRFQPIEEAKEYHGPMKPKASQPIVATQVGGDHYTRMAIQPITYCMANQIGFPEGNVIKYVSRWRNKNGVEDLKKARHMLDVLIEHEEAKGG